MRVKAARARDGPATTMSNAALRPPLRPLSRPPNGACHRIPDGIIKFTHLFQASGFAAGFDAG